MNKVMLIGRFTRDPESRMSASSMEVARFSLACANDFVNKDGQRDTEFINCVAFGRNATTINKYCTKGQMISVIGRIKNGSFDAQDGTKRYTTDIVVDSFEFIGAKNGNANSSYSEPTMNDNIETTDVSEDPYKDFGDEVNISSDDLPF